MLHAARQLPSWLIFDVRQENMRRYHALSRGLYEKLMAIVPSRDGEMEYRPCSVTLRDGTELPCVYVVPIEPYMRYWGVPPEEDSGKRSICVRDVVDLRESKFRLPPRFASKIYEGGESGMGYSLFTVVFRDGSSQPYLTGNAVDFVSLPEGRTPADIMRVERHVERDDPRRKNGAEYYWCIYDGIEPE